MSPTLIPFRVLAEHAARIDAGELARFGTLIKDVPSGRIVAHVQETGLLSAAAAQELDLLGAANPVSFAVEGATLVQNQQIKGKLDAIDAAMSGLETLQMANLAMATVGVGVTVASTAILLQRMTRIETGLEQLSERLDHVARRLRADLLGQTLSDIKTAIRRLAEMFDNPGETHAREFDTADDQLDRGFERLREVLLDLDQSLDVSQGQADHIDPDLAYRLIDAMAVSSNSQISARLWLDQKGRAKTRAQSHAQAASELVAALPGDIFLDQTATTAPSAKVVQSLLANLGVATASRAALVSSLEAQNVNGRAFIEQARSECEEPVLFLAEPS